MKTKENEKVAVDSAMLVQDRDRIVFLLKVLLILRVETLLGASLFTRNNGKIIRILEEI